MNFGLDLSGGVYPWASGSGKECVAKSSLWDWISTGCDVSRKFLCNDCNGKLNQYVLYQTGLGYGYTCNEAMSECSINLDYGILASIHSTRDCNEAKELSDVL